MSKRFILIILAIIVVFVGLFIFNQQDASAPQSGQATTTEHSQNGGANAVSLVEYGDFQCPACGGFYPVLKQIKAKYGDKLSFQFRHFPLASIHLNAMAAHRAAEAAGRQDKFWEMHDKLYETQNSWSRSSNAAQIFEGYAQELGLDVDKYRQDVVDPTTKAVIDADIQAGQDLKATGTPTFVLEGQKLDPNPQNVDEFSRLIDDALAKKQSTTQEQ